MGEVVVNPKEELSASELVRAKALEVAYRIYRRASKAGSIKANDEWLHAVGADSDWNESYYFNFFDSIKGVCGFTRIGILPNKKTDVGILVVSLKKGSILAMAFNEKASIDQRKLSIGGLEFNLCEPLKMWRLGYSGEMVSMEDSRMLAQMDENKATSLARARVELDLTFDALSPCFDFKAADAAALAEMIVSCKTKLSDLRKVSRVSRGHYEQACFVRGGIDAEGTGRLLLDGTGHRDHSWGVRDWSAPRSWTWLTCQFKSGISFNLSRVVVGSVDVFNGFVFRDGANYPVRRARLETVFEEDGITQKEVTINIQDSGGCEHSISGEIETVVPLDLRPQGHNTLVNEAFTRYRLKKEEGLGISEYLHQL